MSSVKWTEDQLKAIEKKGSNILVAAAAGSGKTAVLVERLIRKVIDEKVDIDKLLVVTFTNAAASEMRERMLEALYKAQDKNPGDLNIQKQMILLNKSNICTIHSFCLDVIKNNFYEINIPSNFRIGSEEEIELLKYDVLDNLFEELYENEDKELLKLIDTYTGYKGDEPLKEMILKIYRFIQSSPFPKEWIEQSVEAFNIKDESKDFSDTVWGKLLLKEFEEEIIDCINSLKILKEKLEKHFELEKFYDCIVDDIDNLKELKLKTSNWNDTYEFCEKFSFKKWPIDKKVTMDLKDEAKGSRDVIKKKFNSIKEKILLYDSENAFKDIKEMYEILYYLKNIILKFMKEFKKQKLEKNIIDFNDIEHYALDILVKKNEKGEYVPSEVAKKYQDKFYEIAIDEYQDSNLVQEYILKSVSRNNNIFMVGDVKQSIYKFRQARPELFLEKYNNYALNNSNDLGLKIQLFKNFRSRINILDFTNLIFKSIMSEDLGDIDYNESEFLNLGASFGENDESKIKNDIYIIDMKKEEESVTYFDEEENSEEEEEQEERIENIEVEAKFVANKIAEIVNGDIQVFDKKQGYRKATYKDIVILLRSTSNIAPIFEKELLKKDIPVFSDSSNEYLDTIEIQTIISFLKILDNPINDVALVTVMRSSIAEFTDNDLIEIRIQKKDGSFYSSLKHVAENGDGILNEKCKNFLEMIENYRNQTEYLPLDELIWKVYNETGFYNYVGLMPNGILRQANMKMLFERAKEYEKASFKGLFNFIKFIEKLRSSSGDLASAKIIGENENVVRIMSIHKSKGLEFPIVFLSATNKQFNLMDLNENILLHQDIGIGPKYVNYERKIEYSTAAREAIKIKLKTETIPDEMRIIYVALTRAKEKLIITGTQKDYVKEKEKKEDLIKIYKKGEEKINYLLVKKYKTYLDWIQLVYLNYEEKLTDLAELHILKAKEAIDKSEESENENLEIDFSKYETDFSEIEKIFNWEYKNKSSIEMPSKTSVSKIKAILTENDISLNNIEELKNYKQNINLMISQISLFDEDVEEIKEEDSKKQVLESKKNLNKPKFLENITKVTAAEKGTLMHLILQKINFNKDFHSEDLEELINTLILKNIIKENQAKEIDRNKILRFLESDFTKRIKTAKLVEKERPFYINIPANEIFDEETEDEILVQGIIDLFFIDENDRLILVDYKTDFVKNGEENILIQKYKKQLELYKDAIEKSLNKKVDEIYIYSIYLNKEIAVEN